MKSTLIACGLVLALLSPTAGNGQQVERDVYLFNSIHSIDVPTDARGIALAEALVSLHKNPAAVLYNPAALGGISNISFSYSRRAMDWLTGDGQMQYTSLMASFPTSIVNVGLLYSRFTQGKLPFVTAQNPEGDGTTVELYDHTFCIAAAKQFEDRFNIGLAVKTFNYIFSAEGPSAAMFPRPIETTQLPILFDFGVLYRIPFSENENSVSHQLSVGGSFQNIGTTLKQKTTYRTPAGMIMSEEGTTTLPQQLRFGVSYSLTIECAPYDSNLDPFALLLIGEYRNALNSKAEKTSYWGVGVEMRLFEIASARFGGYSGPYTSVYGKEGALQLRWGVAVQAPLNKLGAGIPLVLHADYAVMPLERINVLTMKKTSLAAFSVGINYEYELF